MAKKTHKHLDFEQRKRLLEILESDEKEKLDYAALAKQFNVCVKTVKRMRSSKQNWKKKIEEAQQMPCFLKRKKVPQINNFEAKLYDWYQQKKSAGELVTGAILKEKALLLNDDSNEQHNFRASKGWLMRFKDRYQIKSCPIEDEKLAENSKAVAKFVEKLRLIMVQKDLKLNQIYNADECGLFWRMLPGIKSTITHNKNEESGAKKSEDRVTIMTCANADGSHKVPLFVIGKSKIHQCFKNFDMMQLPVIYTSQNNAWMTDTIFKQWYKEVFIPDIRRLQKENFENYKVLLILDSANCHLTKEEIDSIDDICSVEFLPPNVEILIQPMSQGIIGKTKNLYRKSFLKELLLKETEESVLQFSKNKGIKSCCMQIANAWEQITPNNLKRSWRKLIMVNDDSNNIPENESICNDEILQLLHRIPGYGKCSPNDVSSWLQMDASDPGWQTVDAQQMDQRIKSEVDDETASEDSDCDLSNSNNDGNIDISLRIHAAREAKEAFENLEKFRIWLDRQLKYDERHLMMLQSLDEFTKEIISQVDL